MKEGSLEKPLRHKIAWQDKEFYDEEKLTQELERVFDICHTCRRCFSLCDSFPKLFDLIDASPTGELDGVAKDDYAHVVDACTLCDMCFMTKCPYVPPHTFDIDFPHLMLRAKIASFQKGNVSFVDKQLAKTDRNGKLMAPIAPLVNWAIDPKQKTLRRIVEGVAGIDKQAKIPSFSGTTLLKRAKKMQDDFEHKKLSTRDKKVVLFATCYGNYNNPGLGEAIIKVLHHNGISVETIYPGCCGMPLLENGDIKNVAERAKTISKILCDFIDRGYEVVAPISSCALMLRNEWPLIVSDDEHVIKVSKHTYDIAHYIVNLAKENQLKLDFKEIDGAIAVHLSCHARAQNRGPKAFEMLDLIPGANLHMIERCSGHGGTWGMKKENFETALKVGKPVARQVVQKNAAYVVSECPLAADHIIQGVEQESNDVKAQALHPVEILARAYGLI